MNTNDTSPRVLIFDVDGTLADTEDQGHRPAFNRAFREFGLDWHWDSALYQRLLAVTGGRERIRHYIDRHAGGPHAVSEAELPAWIAQLHRRKTEIYNVTVRQGEIPLNPGVARLLHEAHDAGATLAIATTTSRENVESLLAANLGAGAVDWFRVIGAGDQVAHKKPAPDIYQWVVEQLSLPPEDCVAFEDSAVGYAAAASAGIGTLVVTCGATGDVADFPDAALIVDHLGDPGNACRVLSGPSDLTQVDLAVIGRLPARERAKSD